MDCGAILFPAVPDAGKGERRAVLHLKVIGLRDLLTGSFPFVKAIGRNEAASSLKGLAEGWFLIDRLDPRINEGFRLFTPERNQAPLQVCDLSDRIALQDGEDVLARRDVVARDDVVEIESIDDALELYSLGCFKRKPATHDGVTLDWLCSEFKRTYVL